MEGRELLFSDRTSHSVSTPPKVMNKRNLRCQSPKGVVASRNSFMYIKKKKVSKEVTRKRRGQSESSKNVRDSSVGGHMQPRGTATVSPGEGCRTVRMWEGHDDSVPCRGSQVERREGNGPENENAWFNLGTGYCDSTAESWVN